MYSFANKFALVTGAGSGLGLSYVRELLLKGVEGVTLVDLNESSGESVSAALNKEFGERVIFVRANVANLDQFEDTFQTSISHWKHLDIVINNAGVLDEEKWLKTIAVNCEGTTRGVHLGFKYMSKVKGGRGGIIVNASSIVGINHYYSAPVYCATKSFVIALSRAMGTSIYYEHTGVKVMAICPGITSTSMYNDILNNVLLSIVPTLKEKIAVDLKSASIQSVEPVAKAMVNIIQEDCNGSVWIAEGGEPPYKVELPTIEDLKKSPAT
ncbi:hypothetical protein RI129_001429 [Pyrocoelia pectoralis]|uniref:15-hydroxyprostaglandin dehydrogenase [NAD(+)]-like n=1 Tax=Pyrocoelia pectoralis TaxID=417401 RepID=A0AAN7VN08_9COLE